MALYCTDHQESIASDAASYALSSTDIAGCVSEVQQFIQALSENRVALSAHSNLSPEVRSD